MELIFIGVGGSGLSSLALILQELGYKNIVGIDKEESQIIQNLKKRGLNIIIGHGNYEIKKDDILIYSDATLNSVELKKAKQEGIKHISYFEFLGQLSKNFKTISVAGTHGKSTTTAMGIFALSQISQDFALGIVGAIMPNFSNQNYYLNPNLKNETKNIFDNIINGKEVQSFEKKYYFIVEADEFNKHFLHLQSEYSIITNMELDHSEIYPNIDEYTNTFKKFAQNTKTKIFSLKKNKNLSRLGSDKIQKIDLKDFDFKYIFGEHNKQNASLICSLLDFLYPSKESETKNIIENFPGLWRRIEFLFSNQNGAKIYTDYGHHPSEINAVLHAFKDNFPNKNLICIFQPHQARRVLEHRDYFIDILKGFNKNYIYDIYIARENLPDLKKEFEKKEFKDIQTISQLGNLFAQKTDGEYTENFEKIQNIINSAGENDIIIIFSAGDLDLKVRNLKF